MIILKNKIMKKLTLTIAAVLICLSSFAETIYVHEYVYTYEQTAKGDHLKNTERENKKGFRLIGITVDQIRKTVIYSYTNSKNIEVIKQLQTKYVAKI